MNKDEILQKINDIIGDINRSKDLAKAGNAEVSEDLRNNIASCFKELATLEAQIKSLGENADEKDSIDEATRIYKKQYKNWEFAREQLVSESEIKLPPIPKLYPDRSRKAAPEQKEDDFPAPRTVAKSSSVQEMTDGLKSVVANILAAKKSGIRALIDEFKSLPDSKIIADLPVGERKQLLENQAREIKQLTGESNSAGEAFIERKRDKDAQGNDRIYWVPPGKTEIDSEAIIYTISPDGKLINITGGKDARAMIVFEPSVENDLGARVVGIEPDKEVVSYGDDRNGPEEVKRDMSLKQSLPAAVMHASSRVPLSVPGRGAVRAQ